MRNSLSGRLGFTLIEVLTAVAVLSILVLGVMELMSGATKTVSSHENRIDTDSQARLIFSTMEADFGHMLRRYDADSIFKDQTGGANASSQIHTQTTSMAGNDYMYFYSTVPGYFSGTVPPAWAQSTVSVVGYWIDPSAGDTNAFRLQRMAKGLTWDNSYAAGDGPSDAAYLTYVSGSATPLTGTTLDYRWPNDVVSLNGEPGAAATSSYYEVLSSDVFRFEYTYLLANGVISDDPYISDETNTTPAQYQDQNTYNLKDVTAIVVTVAMLDEKDRAIVNSLGRGGMQTFITNLGDSNLPAGSNTTSAQTVLPAVTWQNAIDSGTLAAATGVPQSIVSNVRVYQHIFYLNPL